MPARGELFVVATPIGNLGDLSPRAAAALAGAALIAAEDTRRTRKLLSHLGIRVPLLRCDEAAEERAASKVLDLLGRGGNVALVSDGGTPGISDPGSRLVRAARDAGFRVSPLPGPSAVAAALSASGFPTRAFQFFGYLARKGSERKRRIESIARASCPVVFFESPHRIGRTLRELADRIPGRRALLARELTKLHEECVRAPLSELAERFCGGTARGEITVVVEGAARGEMRPPGRGGRGAGEE